MPFNQASVDSVADAVQEIQFLRGIIARPQLKIDDLDQAVLNDAERDSIRLRLLARIENRRTFIVNQVGTW